MLTALSFWGPPGPMRAAREIACFVPERFASNGAARRFESAGAPMGARGRPQSRDVGEVVQARSKRPFGSRAAALSKVAMAAPSSW